MPQTQPPRIAPQIKYNTIVINNQNVMDFIQDDYPVHMGGFDTARNVIVVNKYVLSEPVPAQVLPIVKTKLAIIADNALETVPHEMHHWHNAAFFNARRPRNNNYIAQVSLLVMDEMAARVAGHLYRCAHTNERDDGPTRAHTVARAMRDVSVKFADNTVNLGHVDAFMNLFAQDITVECILDSNARAQHQRLLDVFRNKIGVLFDDKYKNTVTSFFTFDKYCIFRDQACRQPAVIQMLRDADHEMFMIQMDKMTRMANMMEQVVR